MTFEVSLTMLDVPLILLKATHLTLEVSLTTLEVDAGVLNLNDYPK